mgnify:CR=1 FL=1
MGILDLVVLDQNGVPHIFDYKCSDKNNGHTGSLGDFKKSIRENTLYA